MAEDYTIDERDTDLDGVDDAVTLAEQGEENRPYGEVTAEDLSDQDLIDDGADLATSLDDEADERGMIPVDQEIELERDQQETIEDRLLQEEPDPNSDITL